MPKRAMQAEMFAPIAIKPVSSQARAMCSRGKKPAPAPKPWWACILAVDTQENSGWSYWTDGRLICSGEVDTTQTDLLYSIITSTAAKSILVLEAPYGGPKGAHEVKRLIGLGMARERWLRAWKDAGESRSRVVMVQPQTWRAAVLGNVRGMKRDQIREREWTAAKALLDGPVRKLGADEAAAILIGKWAAYAAPIGEVIGKRALKASMEAWQR